MSVSLVLIRICFAAAMAWGFLICLMAGATLFYKRKPYDPTTSWRGTLLAMGLWPLLTWSGRIVMLVSLVSMLALAWKLFVVSLASITLSVLLFIIALSRLKK